MMIMEEEPLKNEKEGDSVMTYSHSHSSQKPMETKKSKDHLSTVKSTLELKK